MGQVDAKRVAQRLGEVFESPLPQDTLTLDVEQLRLVVFSDQHRGQGDGADDFKRCKRAYHAALGHYLEAGYQLCVLGDVEELWECFARPALRTYADTLALEGEFHRLHRYWRVFGNHDDLWARRGKVEQYLGPLFNDLVVHEALTARLRLQGQPLGTMLFVHGHQGTFDSEQASWLSRLVVRYVWRNFQRLTRIRVNKEADDFQMRQQHERAMYDWVATQPQTVLIAGHTHRPVFQSMVNSARLEQLLAGVRVRLAASPGDAALTARAAALRAELEWVRVADGAAPAGAAPKPCYFNSGCCCFDDGDVTGIEVADGEIRLVRWPDNAGAPKAQVLASAPLTQVFAGLP